MSKATCLLDGCPAKSQALGYCNKHYQRLRRTGRPEGRQPLSQVALLMRRTEKQLNGCWIWTGPVNRYGYGLVTAAGTNGARKIAAHTISWELHRGDRGGLFVCHTCDVRRCVNPDHLFLGTHLDNMRDMREKGRSTKGRVYVTACRNGHEYTAENTHVGPDGKRRCRICQKNRSRAFDLRQKEAAA